MSLMTDLKMAYHMGYDDALAKCKPDASKVHMLGRGECRMEPVKDYPVGECATFSFGCVCSECGAFFEYTSGSNWHYCPNCGRKVVTDG